MDVFDAEAKSKKKNRDKDTFCLFVHLFLFCPDVSGETFITANLVTCF